MKLDLKTVNILKNFAIISPSILIKEGNILQTVSPTKTILARAVVNTDFPKKFALYNLSKFLGCLSLINDPSLEFTDTHIKITDNVSTTVNFTYTDESSIKVPPEKAIKLPSKDVCIQLTEGAFKEIIRASGALQLPEIAITGDGINISIQAIDSKNPSGDVYSIVVGQSDKTFRAIFKTENIIKIISGSYNIEISSQGISYFRGEEVEYWIAVEATSTF
jgi:gp45 sliding clamp, C terminal